MIAVVDYKAGNIFSVKNALDYLGCDSVITSDRSVIASADGIILPGVGAFGYAVQSLERLDLFGLLKEQAHEKPFMGICLGMQLLFEESTELGLNKGLGIIRGRVDCISGYVPEKQIIPHMGWNKLEYNQDCPLFSGLSDDEYVYFVHSYMALCQEENLYAFCDYGCRIPAVVSDGETVFGCQFHPEKSGRTGLAILRNFAGLCR